MGTLGANLTNAHKTAVKNALKTNAANAWSNKHSVKVTDPICGEKTLPVRFRVLWKPDDTTDARHYGINLTKSGTRASVNSNFADFDHDDGLADNSWVFKHEFGHLFRRRTNTSIQASPLERSPIKRQTGPPRWSPWSRHRAS